MTEYYRLIAVLAAQVNIPGLRCITLFIFCNVKLFAVSLNREFYCTIYVSGYLSSDIVLTIIRGHRCGCV